MLARGLKRKSEDSAPGPPADGLQRQSLLDMSLVKLQLCHLLAEPDLCRSVLLANTVRQLREDLARDMAARGPLQRLVATEILGRTPWEQQGACLAPDLPGPELPPPLDRILETLEGRAPRAADGLFADGDDAYCGLDTVLTGVMGAQPGPGHGFEGAGCKRDLGELDHVVEILVET